MIAERLGVFLQHLYLEKSNKHLLGHHQKFLFLLDQ